MELPSIDYLTKGFIANSFQQQIFNFKKIVDLGLQMDLNTFGTRNRYIGQPNNNVYPEIVIWRRETLGSNTGQAVAAVVIETNVSLNNPDISKWAFLSSIPILFDLVIPENQLLNVRKLILSNDSLGRVILFTYTYNSVLKKYLFTKV